MTVEELIAELQKMPPDDEVIMWVAPGESCGTVYWVEKRWPDDTCVHLNDKYWTPYADMEENNNAKS